MKRQFLGKEKKILHGMSEIAGQGFYSVEGLKRNGHDAKLAIWRENRFYYGKGLCLHIGKNKLLYPFYGLKMFAYGIYAAFQYDIFHFHFGYSLLPFGLDLWMLKKLNKKVFMEFHGSDIRDKFSEKSHRLLPMREKNLILRIENQVRLLRIFKYIDHYILHDYELIEHFPNREKQVFFVPLRVDLKKFKPKYPSVACKKPVIVHAPSDSTVKGSKYVISAIEALKIQYDIEFILVEGKTQEEAIKIYEKADIIVDQLLAGTYGVFAIEAMALGKPVITFITEKMRGEFPKELPIVNATVSTVKDAIEGLLINPSSRHELGVMGRRYVENYHNYIYVAQELNEIYAGNRRTVPQREAFERIRHRKEKQEKA